MVLERVVNPSVAISGADFPIDLIVHLINEISSHYQRSLEHYKSICLELEYSVARNVRACPASSKQEKNDVRTPRS